VLHRSHCRDRDEVTDRTQELRDLAGRGEYLSGHFRRQDEQQTAQTERGRCESGFHTAFLPFLFAALETSARTINGNIFPSQGDESILFLVDFTRQGVARDRQFCGLSSRSR